ncbi:hypothetical protein B296_00046402 [Ensete ventricosum]|uniref:Uncharacterized protein n=1 Tax=Ensete ventricosum TaxID=4639 RepID=A0A426XIN2_ENSVE|nr:hypothetical protein B296_00046402 [Ensete ventricosum]
MRAVGSCATTASAWATNVAMCDFDTYCYAVVLPPKHCLLLKRDRDVRLLPTHGLRMVAACAQPLLCCVAVVVLLLLASGHHYAAMLSKPLQEAAMLL